MPRQGQSVEMCILTKWFKEKGDTVAKGEPLFSYDTDKASFEQEAEEDGILLEVFFNEDDEVPVLTHIAVIGGKGESVEEFRPELQDVPVGGQSPDTCADVEKKDTESLPVSYTDASGTEHVSPRARARARSLGIDIRGLQGTGPGGRIIEQDVERAAEAGYRMSPVAYAEAVETGRKASKGTGPGGLIAVRDLEEAGGSPGVYTDVKLSNIRKVIGSNMYRSLAESAQLTLHSSADAGVISGIRKKIKQGDSNYAHCGDANINDMVCFAVVRSLAETPAMNALFLGTVVREFDSVHLGVAVDTERGLMVPTILNAEQMEIREFVQAVRDRAAECREGSIDPEKLKHGTFTVTNLGIYGVEMFTPVINPPQAGILGVCALTNGSGGDTGSPRIGLSLTFDHRAIDGAPAARFLQKVVQYIEGFEDFV